MEDFKAYLRDLLAHRRTHSDEAKPGEILTAFAKLFDRFLSLQLVAPAKLSNQARFREVEELQVRL